MIFAALVITGTVNAVNITDGVDGLSSSVTLPVCAFFAASFGYAYLHWDRPGSAGMTVFAAALFGGLVGFLVYNFYPAKVFMGDTGSLFLGGAVCGMAFALDLPLILILVGIIYIVETLSDIIQIVYFKATHGKRIFRMAPLHHHLEMGGWSEKKVVFVFAGISLVFCILAFFGVIGRFPVQEHLAAARGGTTIALTRFDNSPLAQAADLCLYTSSPEISHRSGAMSSRIAQMCMVDVLFTAVARRNYRKVETALENSYKSCMTHRVEAEN